LLTTTKETPRANGFYYDQTNQKQGPVSEQQLKALAAQGAIGPSTPMETDTGHKGTAGQIPGLNFNAAATSQPRQTTPPAAGFSDVMGNLSSPLEKFQQFKPLLIGGIVIAAIVVLGWFVVPALFGSSNPFAVLKKAKSGDWVKYDGSVSLVGMTTKTGAITYKVLANDGKKIKLQITNTYPGLGKEKSEVEFDIPKSQKEYMQSIQKFLHMEGTTGMNLNVEKGKTSRGTVSASGQEFKCTIIPYTVTVTIDNISTTVRNIKVWTSPKVPVAGIAKIEWGNALPMPEEDEDDEIKFETKTFSLSGTLSGFHSNK
jgi:hypothetical protein